LGTSTTSVAYKPTKRAELLWSVMMLNETFSPESKVVLFFLMSRLSATVFW
jgi:hypothetical protein